MTNFQDVVEYRGSGILFSTRKGLRKEVTQRLGCFEYLAAKSFTRAFSRLYRPRNFSPPWNISEATKNDGALLNPAHSFRYFYEESKKLFDVDTVDVILFEFQRVIFSCFSFMRYAVNLVSVALFFSFSVFFSLSSLQLLSSPLFSRFTHTLALTLAFFTVEITIITSRIRDKRRR